MTIARLRAEAEEIYGQRLSEIVPTVDKVQGGFSTDDGASVRKVSLRMGGTQYVERTAEFADAGDME